MKTKQEVYDIVKNHLLTQKVRASSNTRLCAYRGEDGTKCAIGILISDEKYTHEIEGLTVQAQRVRDCLANDIPTDDIYFLVRLQRVHDDFHPNTWFEALKECADLVGLNP